MSTTVLEFCGAGGGASTDGKLVVRATISGTGSGTRSGKCRGAACRFAARADVTSVLVHADDLFGAGRPPWTTGDKVDVWRGYMGVAVGPRDRAEFQARVLASPFGDGYEETPSSLSPWFTWSMQAWVCLARPRE